MTNVTPIGQLFNLPQLTTDAARALVLRIGEEMTATILDMAGNQAVIDTDRGSRLLATVQSDEPLQPGQTVVLQVVESTPQQLTLRLAQPSTGTQPIEAGQLLRSLGLSDTAANRQAVDALMAEGQSVSKQTVQQLRAALAELALSEPEDFKAVAYLMARGLPVTAALVNVVRQGLSGASLVALADELRQEASALLRQLPESEQEDPTVAQLRTALENLVNSNQGDLRDPAALRQAIAALADSLEALLADVAVDEQLSPSGEQSVEETPQQTNVPTTGRDDTTGASATAGDSGSSSSARAPTVGPTVLPVTIPETEASSSNVIVSEAKNPAGVGAAEDSTSPAAPQNDIREGADPQVGTSLPPAASLPYGAEERSTGTEPRQSLQASFSTAEPSTQPDTHLAVRQMLPALEHAIASGILPDAARESAAALRDRAEQFVSNLQFQQIQNGLPASSGGPEYLSFPLALWAGQQHSQGELRMYIHDQTGSRRIDPEDVRIVMKLHMTRLQHLTISVHVLRRNIMCHIDSENPAVDGLVRSAAPELRMQLQQLGYNVAPISCSNLQDGVLSGQQRPASPKLASVNVKA